MVTLKNGSIALASLVIFCVFKKIISPSSAWFVFWSFTILSSFALFGTVGLKTVVNRDMMVGLTAGDELTVLNSKMMAIDRGFNILSVAISGFMITISPVYCIYAIMVAVVAAFFGQNFAINQIGKVMQSLEEKICSKSDLTNGGSFCGKIKSFFTGWYLLVKSPVLVPCLVLASLYLNVLGTGFPLQGFSRQSCVSEGLTPPCQMNVKCKLKLLA